MFTTHTPRQTLKNAHRSPCNHGKENQRSVCADAPRGVLGGLREIAESCEGLAGPPGRSAPAPKGRGLARFSRPHNFVELG